MSDNIFKWSLIAVSILAVLWIILGSIFVINTVWAIIIGLIVWIVVGGTLLHFWGKHYMSQI